MTSNQHEISAAAERTLSKSPEYRRKQFQPPQEEPSQPKTKTCLSCDQSYDSTLKANILSKIKSNYHPQNTCLNCIKAQLKNASTKAYSQTVHNHKRLEIIQKAYASIHNKYNESKSNYQDLDYQLNMITHLQQIQLNPPTKSKSSKPKTTKSAQTLAEEALSNLTPEQQAAVLANLNRK